MDRIKIENIKVGDVFKSYRQLCEALEEDIKSGRAKVNQLERWKRYFSFSNDNYKYIIDDIYNEPKENIKKKRSVENQITHGMTNDRIYKIWSTMKARCSNPKSTGYKYYGGKGISVCKDWKDNFLSFYHWSMNSGYTDYLTIDRIDSNKNYEPSNCRWVTMKIQANNRNYKPKRPNKSNMNKDDLIKYINELEEFMIEQGYEDYIFNHREKLKGKDL